MKSESEFRLVIVDDDEDDRNFLKSALEDAGFAGPVEEYVSGDELLTRLEQVELAKVLVVLDLNMPVIDGYETLRQLQTHSQFAELLIMVLSSSTKMSDKVLCLGLGCFAVVEKPMSHIEYKTIAAGIIDKISQVR